MLRKKRVFCYCNIRVLKHKSLSVYDLQWFSATFCHTDWICAVMDKNHDFLTDGCKKLTPKCSHCHIYSNQVTLCEFNLVLGWKPPVLKLPHVLMSFPVTQNAFQTIHRKCIKAVILINPASYCVLYTQQYLLMATGGGRQGCERVSEWMSVPSSSFWIHVFIANNTTFNDKWTQPTSMFICSEWMGKSRLKLVTVAMQCVTQS